MIRLIIDEDVSRERLDSSSLHLSLELLFPTITSSVGKSLVTEAKLPRDHDNGNDQLAQGQNQTCHLEYLSVRRRHSNFTITIC